LSFEFSRLEFLVYYGSISYIYSQLRPQKLITPLWLFLIYCNFGCLSDLSSSFQLLVYHENIRNILITQNPPTHHSLVTLLFIRYYSVFKVQC
jgi:hypothetical protein